MPEEFTDDELAFLRHVRFGELPARVLPQELVTLVETDPQRDHSGEDSFGHLKNAA
jgi:hypothetical protein